MATAGPLQCYHKGCGKKYDAANNKEGKQIVCLNLCLRSGAQSITNLLAVLLGMQFVLGRWAINGDL